MKFIRPLFFAACFCLVHLCFGQKVDQTITVDPIADKVLGNQPFTVTASASSNLPVTVTADGDEVSINGTTITIVAAGRVTLKFNQAGDGSYNAAPEVDVTFCIDLPKPKVTHTQDSPSTITLVSSNTTGNQWYKDNVPLDGKTLVTLEVSDAGVYTVQSTVEGCSSDMSNSVPVIITGDIYTESDIVSVYPNPVQNKLYIQLAGGNQKRVTLMQMNGHISEEHNTDTSLLEIDVSNYASGLYLVRVADENGECKAIKFIKK